MAFIISVFPNGSPARGQRGRAQGLQLRQQPERQHRRSPANDVNVGVGDERRHFDDVVTKEQSDAASLQRRRKTSKPSTPTPTKTLVDTNLGTMQTKYSVFNVP